MIRLRVRRQGGIELAYHPRDFFMLQKTGKNNLPPKPKSREVRLQ